MGLSYFETERTSDTDRDLLSRGYRRGESEKLAERERDRGRLSLHK